MFGEEGRSESGVFAQTKRPFQPGLGDPKSDPIALGSR